MLRPPIAAEFTMRSSLYESATSAFRTPSISMSFAFGSRIIFNRRNVAMCSMGMSCRASVSGAADA
jgi:hypothetical protein